MIPSFFGGGVKVTEMIFDRFTSRGRPDRGSSIKPSIPFASYRARQAVTVGRETPTRSAIAVLLTPSAANKMILARCAKPARIDDDRVHSVNRCRSPDRNERAATRMHNCPKPTVKLLTTRRTRPAAAQLDQYRGGENRTGSNTHPQAEMSDVGGVRECHVFPQIYY